MPRKCCVPGCQSNYDKQNSYTTAFTFPKNEIWKKKWISCINRQNFWPTPNSAVCIKHFCEDFIVREDKFVQSDGSEIVIPRQKLKLSEDAYPSIFPDQSSYLSRPPKRKTPEKKRDMQKCDTKKFSKSCASDKFHSLENLKCYLKKQATTWIYNTINECLIIYKLNIITVPKITVLLQVFENFSVKLFYENIQVDTKSVIGFALGDSLLLDKKSKLDCVLSFLNNFKLDSKSVDHKVSSVISLIDDICEHDAEGHSESLDFLLNQIQLLFQRRSQQFLETNI